MLGVSEPGALNCYTLFCLIPLTLFVCRNLTLIYLPLSGSLDSLLCDLIASTPGLEFFLLMPPHTLAAASSFSSGRAYSSLNFLLPLFLCLTPTLIMQRSTFLQTIPPRSLFLMFMLPLFALLRRIAEPTPSILPSSRNPFILGDFNRHHPLYDSKSTFDPCGEEAFDWVISSNLFPLNDSDIPTLLHRSSGNRSSPDISFALFSLALSCSWEVLPNLGSHHLTNSTNLSSFSGYSPQRTSPFLQFSESLLEWLCFLLQLSCSSVKKYSSLSLSSAAVLYFSDTECPPWDLVQKDGSIPFSLGKNGSGVLANCSLFGTEATLFFQQAQHAQVFPLKPAPSFKLFSGLRSTNKFDTSFLCSSVEIEGTCVSKNFDKTVHLQSEGGCERDYKGLHRERASLPVWPAHQPRCSLIETSVRGPIVAW